MTIPPMEHAIFGKVITLPPLNPPDPDWLLSQLDSEGFSAELDYCRYLCHALGGEYSRTRFITDALQFTTLANYAANALGGWSELRTISGGEHNEVEIALMPMRHTWCAHMLKHLKEQRQ